MHKLRTARRIGNAKHHSSNFHGLTEAEPIVHVLRFVPRVLHPLSHLTSHTAAASAAVVVVGSGPRAPPLRGIQVFASSTRVIGIPVTSKSSFFRSSVSALFLKYIDFFKRN